MFEKRLLVACCLILFVGSTTDVRADEGDPRDVYSAVIQPLLQKHCVACHGGGEEVHGEVDFTKIQTSEQVDARFEVWETVVQLVSDGSMPPEDQPRLTESEQAALESWYEERFVHSVEAHPGFFRPRRLSAHEYRNTLRSLFGFDLEVAIVEAEQTVVEKSLVMKLLPTDPPGPSGFQNDTSGNPLTTVVWDRYSYLTDNAIAKLFDSQHREELELYTGPIEGVYLQAEQATLLLRLLARRAYRRSIDDDLIRASLDAIDEKQGRELETTVRAEVKTILMSPPFIYRGLLIDVPRGTIPRDTVKKVDDYELAERLSYFLWADMPDDSLLRLAAQGRLSDPVVYRSEIDRMLASPKAINLASDFGLQWFSLGEIDKVSNNPPVADALKQQPIDFLHYLFSEGRPLIELIDSRTTFANYHTAKFYPRDRKQLIRYKKPKGLEVVAVPNQRITLNETTERGGLLTMPGVLAMNKGPVLRGVWMLERVLGEHLPDPPANVGQVRNNKRGEKLTFRERFEQHRSNATCAICHDKIDPLGFAMQAYDVQGGYIRSSQGTSANSKKRKKNKKNDDRTDDPNTVDTSGQLPSGETFKNYQELKQILVTSQKKAVIRNIVRRTMSFALCRQLELTDAPVVDSIVDDLYEQDGTFHDLIHRVANSLPFTHTVIQSN